MRYAVIADIHGNMPALSAVLGDAEKYGVDHYLFIGNYYESLPYPNEVVNAVKALDNAYIVRGNKENYLQNLSGQDQSTWTYEHMAPLYWNYRNLGSGNLKFLIDLPKEITISKEGLYIRMFHSMEHLFDNTKIKELNSVKYISKMKEKPFTHREYLDYINELLSSDENLRTVISGIPAGVYIFGHTHIQWYSQIGKSLLINPGSCGFPLDLNIDASYTILDYDESGWRIEERRIPYDIEDTISKFKSSELYRQSKIWGDIMISQLRTGENKIVFFLKFVKQLARDMNSAVLPYYSNEIWHLAASRWFGQNRQ